MRPVPSTGSRHPVDGATEFLNIDLDIRSPRSLAPLAAAWPHAQRPLRLDGRPNPHWLILSGPGTSKSAEAVARGLLKKVERLSRAARQSWKVASRRRFDIGVQAGVLPSAFQEVVLHPDTRRRIAAVGAQLQITIYAPLRAEERRTLKAPHNNEMHLTSSAHGQAERRPAGDLGVGPTQREPCHELHA
jgi:hypothetical protein